jgi:erythromycin esterase-like protein
VSPITNVGQLARERYGAEAVLVGFSTYTGTVTAATDWDAPAERKRVRPGLPGSFEAVFHSLGVPDLLLSIRGRAELPPTLREITHAVEPLDLTAGWKTGEAPETYPSGE